MLQELIVKILFINNVQQKKILSLDLSASAAHIWPNTRLNNSEFPFIPKQNYCWHFKSHGIEKKPQTLQIPKEILLGSGLREDQDFWFWCLRLHVCLPGHHQHHLSSQNKVASSDQKHRRDFQKFPLKIILINIILANIWLHQTYFPSMRKKKIFSER